MEVYNLWRGVGDLMKLRARWAPTSTTTRFGVCLPPARLAGLGLDGLHPGARPGTAVFHRAGRDRKYLCIKCQTGWVAVNSIYYGKRKEMSPQDFANGFLGTKSEHLFVKDE